MQEDTSTVTAFISVIRSIVSMTVQTTLGGLYDRLDVMWNPYVCDFMQISVGARFHFNDFRYSGCRQIVKIAFNLSGLMNRRN
jgi:hypothetical protein